MSDKQLTPREAAQRILDAARQKMESEVARLIKTEELGKSLFGLPTATPSARSMADGQQVHQQAPSKSVFKLLATKQAVAPVQKAETYINTESESVPGGARYKEVGKPAGNLPGDRKEKEVSAPGSGGEMKKAGMDMGKPPEAAKAPVAPTAKPAGVPGAKAGQAPTVPTPPAAPGMKGNTMKSEKGVFARLSKKVK